MKHMEAQDKKFNQDSKVSTGLYLCFIFMKILYINILSLIYTTFVSLEWPIWTKCSMRPKKGFRRFPMRP